MKQRCDDNRVCLNTVKSVVPDSLSQCNLNRCYSVAKVQRILFQKKKGI